MDITVIQDWLGHVSVDTTCRYKVIPVDVKREALQKFYLFAHSPQAPTAIGIDGSLYPDFLAYLESYATEMLRAGVSLPAVMHLLGHKT